VAHALEVLPYKSVLAALLASSLLSGEANYAIHS